VVEDLNLLVEGPSRQQFLGRLQGEITKRGVVDILRKGIKHGPAHVDLLYGTPTPGNLTAQQLFKANIFSVTRQLHYSPDQTQLALDLCLFINGLPVATFDSSSTVRKTLLLIINDLRRRQRVLALHFHPAGFSVHAFSLRVGGTATPAAMSALWAWPRS